CCARSPTDSRRSRWDSTCRRWSSCSRSTFSSRSWSARSTISPRASGSESEVPMRISPLDIRQQQFTVKMLRGFDPHEVDAFLDDVAEDYEAVLRENALLKEQLITLEERSRGVADREKAIQDTLVATQRLGDEMKAAARRVAEPPVEGEANAAVVALVARALRIAPSTVRVVRGKRGRDKLVRLTGLGDDEAQSRLASLPGYPRLTTTSRSPQ